MKSQSSRALTVDMSVVQNVNQIISSKEETSSSFLNLLSGTGSFIPFGIHQQLSNQIIT